VVIESPSFLLTCWASPLLKCHYLSMGEFCWRTFRGPTQEIFASAVLTRRTDRTVISAAKLKGILEFVKRNGYAIMDRELELGLRSLPVPIRNPT